MTLLEMVKILCIRLDISLAELARRCGESPQNFRTKLKRGKLSREELNKIARTAGCTLKYGFIMPWGDVVE